MKKETEHNCPHCARNGKTEAGASDAGLLKGWRLGLASACVFLLPLLGSLVGIAALNRSEGWQVAGGLIGLVAGLMLAMALARFFKKKTD